MVFSYGWGLTSTSLQAQKTVFQHLHTTEYILRVIYLCFPPTSSMLPQFPYVYYLPYFLR